MGLISIRNGNKELRLAGHHALYLSDTLENFDFYFDSVEPVLTGGVAIVDYSHAGWHSVKGFDSFPVYFPAVAEPVITTYQYLEFADLREGSVALDLGAYSGLTSILFDQRIGSSGLCIALEADVQNIVACEKNLALYRRLSGRAVELVGAAIWRDSNGISFSVEGSMGSSAAELVGSDRGRCVTVPSMTLDDVAAKFSLARVDFIKCDIEGAETEVFLSSAFFAKFRPKIVIECHVVNGQSTEARCTEILKGHGYVCELREQVGYPLPLLFATPVG